MRGFAALIVLALGFVTVFAEPAPAQQRKSKGQSAQQAPKDPEQLARLCSQLVFRKYGQKAPLHGANMVQMPAEQHAQKQNSCIMSKGRIF
jgi:hypothetical protein